jgi:asparagine synthase (glutamine-hydrolysing)
LYVAASDRQTVFASELKALCAAGFCENALDWDALDAYFHLGYVPAPYTAFRHVCKLAPGHVLVWRSTGGWTDGSYGDLPRDAVNRREV